ncbi:MAG: polysaccharide deacetylase family protein [Hyphomicrobium sp.]|jgi:peptidoglycan/xylan/chitin deacetylase (PgdA/CDA1 family)
MSRSTTSLLKAAMSALHYSGAGRIVAPVARGRGIIFMLHSVHPAPPEPFEPNRILRVTPAFLEAAIEEVRAAGYDVISLDEVARRLTEGPGQRPFASFTLDDGYRDNREFAYPVFKRMGVPFTIYVATEYADGRGALWWLVLEEAIKKVDHLEVTIGNHVHRHTTRTSAQKYAAFHAIYWALRAQPEHELRAAVNGLAARAGYDAASLCAELIMSWDEIRALAEDPLVTIGAHTRQHLALSKLSVSEARAEISESVARIEAELGRPCRHFSFPYGDETSAGEREFALAEELGLRTAVTTRKGVIRRSHATRLTALPRASLNGDFQSRHCVRLLLTGAPFMLFDAARAARSTLESVTYRQAAPSI